MTVERFSVTAFRHYWLVKTVVQLLVIKRTGVGNVWVT